MYCKKNRSKAWKDPGKVLEFFLSKRLRTLSLQQATGIDFVAVGIAYFIRAIFFAGGLLCFNIRVNELEDYQAKMLELEGEGKWEKISQKTIPLYATDDMPKETLAFLYRVLKT